MKRTYRTFSGNRTVRGTATSLLCVGFLTTGVAAFAQDTVGHEAAQQTQNQDEYSSTSPNQSTTTSTTTTTSTSKSSSSKHRVMKDCIARERAGDSTMSESEAKKACHDALKAQSENQDNEPQPH
jgi:hypothetical protein